MKKLFTSFFILVSTFVFTQAPTFDWVRQIGGIGSDFVNSLAVDNSGNVFACGSFVSTSNFGTTSSFSLTSNGQDDIFISKMDASGNFLWVKQIGGKSGESPSSILLDPLNNIYVVGNFRDTVDFDPGIATFTLNSFGIQDAFALKLDPSGNFISAKQFGGNSAFCWANSVNIDGGGNSIITGGFQGIVDFDPGPGTFTANSLSFSDLFITKLDVSGNFVWTKEIAGKLNVGGRSATSSIGEVYTTGYFNDTTDFDPSITSYTLAPVGPNDIFISKLDNSGNFIWVKQFGSNYNNGYESGSAISIDKSNNVICTGYFGGVTDFDPGVSSYTLNTFGDEDVFILKLNSVGNFIWAKQIGDVWKDIPNSLTTDLQKSVYLTGYYSYSPDCDPGPSSYTLSNSGGYDTFILKLDSMGKFAWAKKIGGTINDIPKAICLDSNNDVYTAGSFMSTANFDTDGGIYNLTAAGIAGPEDTYIHKMKQGFAGINEVNLVKNILLYPNPTNGQVNLQFFNKPSEKTEIKIFNSLGQIILQKNISSTDKISLSISDQPSGIYFVEVNADGESYRAKVVKE